MTFYVLKINFTVYPCGYVDMSYFYPRHISCHPRESGDPETFIFLLLRLFHLNKFNFLLPSYIFYPPLLFSGQRLIFQPM